MNETMKSRWARLLADPRIEGVDINYKCKTKDGMIYTLLQNHFDRAACEKSRTCAGNPGFAEAVDLASGQELVELTDIIENHRDNFFVAIDEKVSVQNSEIIRVWAEIGDIHMSEIC